MPNRGACLAILLRPLCGRSVPAMAFQFEFKYFIQVLTVTGADVSFHVSDFSHAGYNRMDIVIAKNKTQRHLGHGHAIWYERSQRIGMIHA